MKKPSLFSLEAICRVLSPVFAAAFYVFLVLIALLLVAIPIVALAGASAAEMLLPPFMREVEGGYAISLGNGIKMMVPEGAVGPAEIKASLYITFLLWAAFLAVCMPVCRFLARLCAIVRDGRLFDLSGPRYIKYIGLTVAVGGVLLSLFERYYNFRLVELFASGYDAVSFAAGVDLMPVALGLIIMLLSAIYGRACREQQSRLPDLPRDGT